MKLNEKQKPNAEYQRQYREIYVFRPHPG